MNPLILPIKKLRQKSKLTYSKLQRTGGGIGLLPSQYSFHESRSSFVSQLPACTLFSSFGVESFLPKRVSAEDPMVSELFFSWWGISPMRWVWKLLCDASAPTGTRCLLGK